jgi:hypothetical protein
MLDTHLWSPSSLYSTFQAPSKTKNPSISPLFLVQTPILDSQVLLNDVILCTGLSPFSYFHRKWNISPLLCLYWYPLRKDGNANVKLYSQTEMWCPQHETLGSLKLGTNNVLAFPQMQTHMLDPPFSWCLTSWFTRVSLDFSRFLIHYICELLCKFK